MVKTTVSYFKLHAIIEAVVGNGDIILSGSLSNPLIFILGNAYTHVHEID